VARRPVPVALGALALLGALAAGLGSAHPNYDPVAQLPGGTEAARAYADLRRSFPAGALNPTDVYLHGGSAITGARLRAFVARLGTVQGVAGMQPPVLSAHGT